jgi:HAD superfamily hydrolase (TIGR01509 family)
MIQALIFDFDGLILDTEISALQSWQEIYEEFACDMPVDQWNKRIGGAAELFDPFTHLEEQLGKAINREELRKRRQKRHMEMIESQIPLPGVTDYIRDAHKMGMRLAVASSSPLDWVGGHLSRLGLLEQFDCLCCGDQVSQKKPDPELYLLALATLGVPAEQALALEDSPNGTLAAQRAGIFCVTVPNPVTGRLPLEHADMRLTSLADFTLTDLLTEVERRIKERPKV